MIWGREEGRVSLGNGVHWAPSDAVHASGAVLYEFQYGVVLMTRHYPVFSGATHVLRNQALADATPSPPSPPPPATATFVKVPVMVAVPPSVAIAVPEAAVPSVPTKVPSPPIPLGPPSPPIPASAITPNAAAPPPSPPSPPMPVAVAVLVVEAGSAKPAGKGIANAGSTQYTATTSGTITIADLIYAKKSNRNGDDAGFA
eukprot:TRINITY_DN36750_c0_g1_i1.p1 TRINITY_DN36750_c0_g1~~TRINITY_DN36750_c0_g1_i1.p1  ORF type:complete len:201 (+),score=28.95 TRINITY_DN36750_c0_g1_i1:42-644(+)